MIGVQSASGPSEEAREAVERSRRNAAGDETREGFVYTFPEMATARRGARLDLRFGNFILAHPVLHMGI